MTARRDKRDKKLQSHSGLCSRSIPRDTEIQLPLSIHLLFLSPTRPFPPNRQTFYSFLFSTQGFIFPSSLKKRKEKEIPPFIFFILFFLISLYSITDFLHNLALQSPLQLSPVIKLSEQLYWQNHIPAWQTWAGGAEVWSRNWLCRLMEWAGFRWGDSIENRKTGEGGCLCTKDSEMTFSCSVYPIKWSRGVQLGSIESSANRKAGETHKSDTCTVLRSAEAWSRHSHWERMFLAVHSLSNASKNPHSSFPLSLHIMTFVGHHFTT